MPAPFRNGRLTKGDLAIRDQAILARRLSGDSIKEIQERFNMSRSTVDRCLSRARKAAIVQTGQDFILTDILPLALLAIRNAIKDGDVETAMKVVEGIGVIGKNAINPGDGQVVEETFEALRKRVVRRIDEQTDYIDVSPAHHEQTIENYQPLQLSPDQHREADGQAGLQSELPGSTVGGERGE